MYADVVLRNKSRYADMLFTYKVPKNMEREIEIGHRISVPFGNSNKPTEGFVFSVRNRLTSDDIDVEKIKEIEDILDEVPMITLENIKLIKWMRNRYICTYMDCVNLFYPKGYRLEAKKIIEISSENSDKIYLNDTEINIYDHIKNSRNALEPSDLYKLFSKKDVSNIIEKGAIKQKWVYENKKNEKTVKALKLSCENNEVEKYIAENIKKLGSKQKEILNYLIDHGEVIFNDLKEYVSNVSLTTARSLEKKGLITILDIKEYRLHSQKFKVDNKKIILNENQREIANTVISSVGKDKKKPFLLHGVTGSGKTEVYMEIIDYVLGQGMDSLFLVPEIALTPQMIARIKNRFNDSVGVFHSKLSVGERHDLFRLVGKGEIRIVIGTRSAMFLPFKTLGLVVVDEEHDMSYRSEQTPKYDAVEIARYFSEVRGITVVLGSATPSISDYYKAKNGEYSLLEMKTRANDYNMPEVEVVDMREELHRGNRSELSYKLISEIKKTVDDKNQVILFLNRRGYAGFVNCRDCGYVFTCDSCDISLTYHKYKKKGVCHYCGREESISDVCHKCGGTNISVMGVGTEKIEEELNEIFPNYKIARVDKDTTSKKDQLEGILDDFNSGKLDILIGTQMLSKGHDFKNVTLVGIISADMMLNFPDFRSYENTFQLITQVSGRTGRSDKGGKVILQTYNTDHFAIKRACNYDYIGFYEDEIRLRKIFSYEPFNNMLRILFSGKNYSNVKINAFRFVDTITYLLEEQKLDLKKNILGPNECAINKIKDKYRWQIIIKDIGVDVKYLKSMVKYIVVTKYEEIFDSDIEINVEVNPSSFI